jgi:hypothetical protein
MRMTQDAKTSPLAALNATLGNKLAEGTPFDPQTILDARARLVAAGLNPDAKITEDADGNFPIKPEDRLARSESFYAALDHVEATGSALLRSEAHAAHEGFTVYEPGEHTVQPAAPAPTLIEHAHALPLALPGDVLHRSEHAVFQAFMDVGDVLRHVYLNVRGLWVKQ